MCRQAAFEESCSNLVGALTLRRKQSDGDDSEDEEVVKRPKAVRGCSTVDVFPVFVWR